MLEELGESLARSSRAKSHAIARMRACSSELSSGWLTSYSRWSRDRSGQYMN